MKRGTYMKGLKWNGYKASDVFLKVPQTQTPRVGNKGDVLQIILKTIE